MSLFNSTTNPKQENSTTLSSKISILTLPAKISILKLPAKISILTLPAKISILTLPPKIFYSWFQMMINLQRLSLRHSFKMKLYFFNDWLHMKLSAGNFFKDTSANSKKTFNNVEFNLCFIATAN